MISYKSSLAKIITVLFLLLVASRANAQRDTADNNTFDWEHFAKDTSLTFPQIVTICDSLFDKREDKSSDTDEDGPAVNYSRWKNFYASRLDAATMKIHDFAGDAIKQITTGTNAWNDCGGESDLQSSIGSIIQNGEGWKYIGPQNVAMGQGSDPTTQTSADPPFAGHAGRATAICVNPANHNEIYIASEWGGLWHTTTGGASWVCLTDNDRVISGIGVTNFTVDFLASPHCIYFSLGYPIYGYFDTWRDPNFTVGLFCSVDDGQTFHNIDLTSVIPDFHHDVIHAVSLYPGTTTNNHHYLFISTQYKILRLDITDIAPTFNPPTISTILDYAGCNNAYTPAANPTAFHGFSDIAFQPSDPTKMMVATLSDVSYAGIKECHILSTTNCLAPAPSFIDVTSNLYDATPAIIEDFVVPTQNPPSNYLPPNWYSTYNYYPLASSPSDQVFDWAMNTTNNDIEWTPVSAGDGQTVCLEKNVDGTCDGMTYPVSFKATLPAQTSLNVYLKASGVNNGPDCGPVDFLICTLNGPASGAPVTQIYTYSPNPDHYVDRLIFKAATTTGYTSGAVIIDDVTITKPHFDYISLFTSRGVGVSDFIFTRTRNNTNGMTYIQRTQDNGASWLSTFLHTTSSTNPSIPFNIIGVTAASTTTPINFYACRGGVGSLYQTDLSGLICGSGCPVESTYDANCHTDIRSIEVLADGNGGDDIYIGNDGGLNRYVNGNWTNLNGTGFNSILPWAIGSSLHTGDVGVAVADNGLLHSNERNLKNWKYTYHEDGGDIKYGQRYSARNVLLMGHSGDGGTTGISYCDLNNLATPFFDIGIGRELSLHKIRTTFSDEYFGSYSNNYYLDANGHTQNYVSYDLNDVINTGSATPTPRNLTFIPGTPPTSKVNWPNIQVQAIAADMYNPNEIACFVHTNFWDHGQLVTSSDGGTTWNTPVVNPANWIILDLCADPRTSGSNKKLWAAGGYYSNAGQDRVFISLDNGQTWANNYSEGLPEGPVNVLRYDDQSHYLFAGTDMGVYARNVDDPNADWQCYSLNLPNGFVTDLDINRCTGKIYAALLGRGGYEADLPVATDLYGDQNENDFCNIDLITTNTTWSADKDETKTIRIKSGAKLTINNSCTISMSRNKNIVVEPGASLIVDGATITNSCGSMWGGVIVLGSGAFQDASHISQEYSGNQGFVKLENSAVIENAYTGLHVGGAYNDGTDGIDYAPGHDGGLVIATTDATFHNCAKSVMFWPYSYNQNSSFDHCHFVSDAYLQSDHYINYDAIDPRRFGSWIGIRCDHVHGVSVTSTDFINNFSGTFNPDPDLRGNAIQCFDGSVKVDDGHFTNLTRGILSLNATSPFHPTVINGFFTNVWRSATFCGANNSIFENNAVTPGQTVFYPSAYSQSEDPTFEFALYPFGVYFSQAPYFRINRNDIEDNQANVGSYGILTNATHYNGQSSLNAYAMYQNKVSTFFGVTAHQDNQNMQVKCNDIYGNAYDIGVTPSQANNGLVSAQGHCLNNPLDPAALTAPAGNRFAVVNTCSSSNLLSFYPDAQSQFIYSEYSNDPFIAHCYYHGAGTNNISSIATPHNCGVNCPDISICCPDVPYVPGGTVVINPGSTNGTIGQLDAATNLALGKIDNGDPAGLTDAINNTALSSAGVGALLLKIGPYLSDGILELAITRTPAMDPADLKPVIIANAGLTTEVWDMLDLNYPVLTADGDVIKAQQNQSARAELEGTINSLYIQRNDLIAMLADYYTEKEDWKDAAALYMSYAEYERAVPYYIEDNDLASASDAAAKIKDKDTKSLVAMYIDKVTDKRRFDALNATEEKFLNTVAADPHSHAGELARIWLAEAKDMPYYELMPMNDALIKEYGNKQPHSQQYNSGAMNGPATKKNEIKIYPNPASTRITVAKASGNWNSGALITAYSTGGLRMVEVAPETGTGSTEINVATWVPGIYFVIVQDGSNNFVKEKVIIQKP